MQKLLATGTTAALRPGSLPPIVMGALDGLLATFVNHAEETARSPQPFLALGAALCCIGAAAGRRYRSETNVRTNTMVVALADSGGGKERPRELLADAFVRSEMPQYLGGSRIASSAGVLSALKDHPVQLFALDEIGHMLSINGGKNAGSHKAEILPLLTELYSRAGGIYLGTNYADTKLAPKIILHQPHVALFGVTVPGTLWKSFGSGALSDGSLARFLVFQSPLDYPDTQRPQALPFPDSLIVGLRKIAGLDGGDLTNIVPQMDAGTTEEARIVPCDDEAGALLEAVSAEELALKRMHTGTSETSFWARFYEHTVRVAMIAAISRNPDDPMITERDVRWSRALVVHCIATVLEKVSEHVADSDWERDRKAVASFIRKAGGPVSGTELTRGLRQIDAKDRAKIIGDLAAAGEIVMAEDKRSGRPMRTYIWAG